MSTQCVSECKGELVHEESRAGSLTTVRSSPILLQFYVAPRSGVLARTSSSFLPRLRSTRRMMLLNNVHAKPSGHSAPVSPCVTAGEPLLTYHPISWSRMQRPSRCACHRVNRSICLHTRSTFLLGRSDDFTPPRTQQQQTLLWRLMRSSQSPSHQASLLLLMEDLAPLSFCMLV